MLLKNPKDVLHLERSNLLIRFSVYWLFERRFRFRLFGVFEVLVPESFIDTIIYLEYQLFTSVDFTEKSNLPVVILSCTKRNSFTGRELSDLCPPLVYKLQSIVRLIGLIERLSAGSGSFLRLIRRRCYRSFILSFNSALPLTLPTPLQNMNKH